MIITCNAFPLERFGSNAKVTTAARRHRLLLRHVHLCIAAARVPGRHLSCTGDAENALKEISIDPRIKNLRTHVPCAHALLSVCVHLQQRSMLALGSKFLRKMMPRIFLQIWNRLGIPHGSIPLALGPAAGPCPLKNQSQHYLTDLEAIKTTHC